VARNTSHALRFARLDLIFHVNMAFINQGVEGFPHIVRKWASREFRPIDVDFAHLRSRIVESQFPA
jgi:hypothetical protein